MGMKVYQSRRDNRSGYVADLGARIGLQAASDLRHLAPRECHVGDGIELLRRIDDSAAAQDEVAAHFTSIVPSLLVRLCAVTGLPSRVTSMCARYRRLLEWPSSQAALSAARRSKSANTAAISASFGAQSSCGTRSTSRSSRNRSCSSLPAIIRCAACAIA